MSRTYITNIDAVGCQFQAFLIKLYVTAPFRLSDPDLTCCQQIHACRCLLDISHGV